MRTFDERKKFVEEHMKTIRIKRKKSVAVVTSLTVVVAMMMAFLFIPYDKTPPDINQYSADDYFDLIQKINLATYEPPKHNNRFESMAEFFMNFTKEDAPVAPGNQMTGAVDTTQKGEMYVEVTDNQVSGVTESDIFKRSTDYIFYLRDWELSVYSIGKENAAPVATFRIEMDEEFAEVAQGYDTYLESLGPAGPEPQLRLRDPIVVEMYLSADASTVTVVAGLRYSLGGIQVPPTTVITLDVSDPANIREMNRVFVTGTYLSSRVVDGTLLLMCAHQIIGDGLDFSNPATFVPQVGNGDAVQMIAPENIYAPEELSNLTYTVICTMDAQTLEMGDCAAFLSFSNDISVSRDTIYATRVYSHKSEQNNQGYYTNVTMTEISGIRFTGRKLTWLGSVCVEGWIKDQYSMDQQGDILRLVTSTVKIQGRKDPQGHDTMFMRERNVNLYCVDLEKQQVVASVIGFAPEGESAQSVRFDGNKAYVCTAEIITAVDPVYFFDLSDLDHITWKDTGVIAGYSTSLIQLSDGYLMGVGYGSGRQLKIEIYQEVDGKVVSVCSFTRNVDFSEAYKSYYIDRENNMIGLGVMDTEKQQSEYILLQFDGRSLNLIVTAPIGGDLENVRSTVIDGLLYVFSDDFMVRQIG